MFGSSIDPDVSMRKTRLARGCSAGSISKPLMPIWTSRVSGFHGVGMTETLASKRHVGARRPRIVVGKVVDQLLDPHRVLLRQHAVVQRGAREGIGRRVDVDGEGRDRLLGRKMDRVGVDLLELVAALVMIARLLDLLSDIAAEGGGVASEFLHHHRLGRRDAAAVG